MKKIIVPIDFSDESHYAFDVAIQISQVYHQEIVLIHIIELPTHFVESGIFTNYNNIYEGMFEDLKKKNEALLTELIQKHEGEELKLSYYIELGHLTESIIKYCENKDNNVGLLIMGTKGSSGINEILIGSNAEKIVRFAPCPVLTIHQPVSTFNPENIVFASHFETTDAPKMSAFIDFISLFPSVHIHLVRINTPSNFVNSIKAENAIMDFVNFWNLKNYTIHLFDYEDFEHGLFFFQKRVQADCIVLGIHKRTGLQQLFMTHHTEHIVNQFTTPILTFKM